MKKTILFTIFLFSAISMPIWCQYAVKGGVEKQFFMVENVHEKIYVYLFNSLSDVKISFTSNLAEKHLWYRYNAKSLRAIPIPCQQDGKTSFITNISDECGYFIKLLNDSSTYCVWIIDYSTKQAVFNNLHFNNKENYSCDKLTIIADIKSKPLEYITQNGQKISLPRIYHLIYNDLKWDENTLTFVPIEIIKEYKDPFITIDAPLKNTTFTLVCDEYAKYFGLEQKISTTYRAIALKVYAKATSLREINKKEQNTSFRLRESAPIEINFTAYSNELINTMYIWKIYKINLESKDSTIIVRCTGKSLNYIFKESGTFVAKLEVINAQSICSDRSQEFNISIEDSDLQLPNIFILKNSTGINDGYRVSYKSLISFKAFIYNRWGNLLYHWEDPNQSWDGKVNGQYVPIGVYFIEVEAKGADGIVYKKSSDINILRSKI